MAYFNWVILIGEMNDLSTAMSCREMSDKSIEISEGVARWRNEGPRLSTYKKAHHQNSWRRHTRFSNCFIFSFNPSAKIPPLCHNQYERQQLERERPF